MLGGDVREHLRGNGKTESAGRDDADEGGGGAVGNIDASAGDEDGRVGGGSGPAQGEGLVAGTLFRLLRLVQVNAAGMLKGTLKAGMSAPPAAAMVKAPGFRKRVLGSWEIKGIAPPRKAVKNPGIGPAGMTMGAPELAAILRVPALSPLPVGATLVRIGRSLGV